MSRPAQTPVPGPARTPAPPFPSSSSSTLKRKRAPSPSEPAVFPRATIANQSQIDDAKAECFDTNNAQLSCWPVADTVINQNEASQFVWNSNQPSFAQFNLVNIGLFRADTGEVVSMFPNVTNPRNRAGSQPVTADDAWWGTNGPSFSGTTTAYAFYFAIVANGSSVEQGVPQTTFTAVQTALPNTVIASLSSASSASSASAASASLSAAAASASGASSTVGTSVSSQGTAGLQNASSGSTFPHWAIALIVVLGFLALVATVACIFVLSRARRRRQDQSRRGSLGSQSPMMADVGGQQPSSPIYDTAAAAAVAGGAVGGTVGTQHAPSSVSPDGASSYSDNLISSADAALMAEAFRHQLRNAGIDQPVEEGESPDTQNQPDMLSRELAEEGRDIRSVGSSRGVRVETLSDTGETITGGGGRNSFG